MEPYATTTPFGRRSLTLAHVASQAIAKQRPPGATAHKWSVFRSLCLARAHFGLSERSLAVLDALLSFHPETMLTGDGLIVFPSNEQLSLRAHGMAASTLRRHLAALVEAGVILRRDSPNGKRYARKGRDGDIAKAFGFDLSPLVARAEEIEAFAEAVRAEARAVRYARERITLARRDIAKMIAAGMAAGVPAGRGQGAVSWADRHARFRSLVARVPKTGGRAELEPLADELVQIANETLKALEDQVKSNNSSGNESRSERHIQNSNSQPIIELEPSLEKEGAAASADAKTTASEETPLPLGMVLQACPDILDYTRDGIRHWRDLVAAASVARAALGVSVSAWEAATAAMGETTAAIVVASILQRGAAIVSAGGYLRELTRKAQANEFSAGRMLMALIVARDRGKKRA